MTRQTKMNEAPELPSEGQDDLYEHFRFVADKGQQPLRVDKYLMNRIENATRNKIQKATITITITTTIMIIMTMKRTLDLNQYYP